MGVDKVVSLIADAAAEVFDYNQSEHPKELDKYLEDQKELWMSKLD